MRYRKCFEIETNTNEEQQFVLTKFPSSVWIQLEDKIRFYIPHTYKDEVIQSILEWKEKNRE
jgi:hypothetical protein